eukprot:ctg_1983.g418
MHSPPSPCSPSAPRACAPLSRTHAGAVGGSTGAPERRGGCKCNVPTADPVSGSVQAAHAGRAVLCGRASSGHVRQRRRPLHQPRSAPASAECAGGALRAGHESGQPAVAHLHPALPGARQGGHGPGVESVSESGGRGAARAGGTLDATATSVCYPHARAGVCVRVLGGGGAGVPVRPYAPITRPHCVDGGSG